ncbi:rCG42531 [Rattus norvegicus]|uniref:RCG42531 n=1 Tax=Rattus norvegicus TaxID=10116 RepID=A6K1Z7_RAT|nr:rCG42531 [Rattus norvegicus]
MIRMSLHFRILSMFYFTSSIIFFSFPAFCLSVMTKMWVSDMAN